MGRINQEILEDVKAMRATDNAKLAAETPPKAPDTSISVYSCATETDCESYSKLTNPGRSVIDTKKSAEVITIGKVKHDIELKEYAVYTVVDSVVQHYLCKVFGTEIFANMLTGYNFVLNKYTTLQMRQHLDTKFNKLNSNHIKDDMIEFVLPPTPDAPLGLYFAIQNRRISVLAYTDEQITESKRLCILIDHLQGIPSMQPEVDEYNKLVQSERPKSWNKTRKFFIKEDLKATDNFQALSKAGIGRAHNAVTNEHINQLQSHTSSLLDWNAMYDKT